MKNRLIIIPLIFFLLIILNFYYLLIIERNNSEIPSNLINKEAPYFKAESLFKDKEFISSEHFGNEMILVNFFATWCKPCLDEHEFIKGFSTCTFFKMLVYVVSLIGVDFVNRCISFRFQIAIFY